MFKYTYEISSRIIKSFLERVYVPEKAEKDYALLLTFPRTTYFTSRMSICLLATFFLIMPRLSDDAV